MTKMVQVESNDKKSYGSSLLKSFAPRKPIIQVAHQKQPYLNGRIIY